MVLGYADGATKSLLPTAAIGYDKQMRRSALLFTSLVPILVASASAQVKPAPVFSSDMVLQRGIDLPVWGTAVTGETVTVNLLGQTLITKAVSGRWMVRLKSMTAGGPYVMTVQGASNQVTLSNVMVGEVWLCSGQSNMVFPLAKTIGGAAALKTAARQTVRMFVSPSGGWNDSSSPKVANFSAVAYYFGRDLANNLGVTVGLIQAAVGATPVAMWRRGGGGHNTHIAPLIPFGLGGAIWYQGEADAKAESVDYASQFQAMIRDWREDWGQGDFPFLYVQLPRYTKRAPGWMYIREAQLRSLVAPMTGMVCTIDIVSAGGIHPTIKLPVGRRLALAARRIAYGQTLVHSGPIFDPRKTSVTNSSVLVGFRHGGSGLTFTGTTLKGFEIAGSNNVFVAANAAIVGDRVSVSSPNIAKPVAVRYSWALYPKGNLFNKEGLPSSPFRSYANYLPFGSACGQNPAPSLRATLLPRLSRPCEIRLENLSPGKPGLMFSGLSDRDWAGVKLPEDLTLMGMTGCNRYCSGEVLNFFVVDKVGAFDFRFGIPNDTGLLGIVFFNQALAIVPGANPLGVAVTNPGRGRIGPR